MTTPTSKLVDFSVHPPAYRPTSPKAVLPPFDGGVTWGMRVRAFQPLLRVTHDRELFTRQRVLCRNAQSSVVYVQEYEGGIAQMSEFRKSKPATAPRTSDVRVLHAARVPCSQRLQSLALWSVFSRRSADGPKRTMYTMLTEGGMNIQRFQDSGVDAPRYVLAAPPEQTVQHTVDILVIGSGAAGLSAALQTAEQAEVYVLTRGMLPQSNSARAQGGIAAALNATDSPASHIADTLVAGAGLSDQSTVETLATEAPALMREMAQIGVPFECENGEFALGLEGGHSHRRILHVGDATGWALVSTLIERVRACPRIHILEGYQVVDLLGESSCTGALAIDTAGVWHRFRAGATILATGGAGALYGLTSNQPSAVGEGVALAYRAGAAVSDMEFVQFHPTVFRTHDGSGFLISEATRGEGGRLLTPDGYRFMPDYDPRAELAPRDIVARGIFAAMRRANTDHVLLDLTHLSREFLERHFPTIYTRCCAEGLDPAVTPIPVAPAAHYLMGGVRTDQRGETNVRGLYAAGECACTGVHGANRLASNSLLECLVFGRRAAAAALSYIACPRTEVGGTNIKERQLMVSPLMSSYVPDDWQTKLATVMRDQAGLQRSAAELTLALRFLETFPSQFQTPNPDAITAANAALVARLIVTSALLREESRGAHFRVDFPHPDDSWRTHIVLTRGQSPHLVEAVADETVRAAA